MRRLLTGLVVALGLAALWRRLRRRKTPDADYAPPPAQDPADELRAKLAESRVDDETPAEPPTSPSTVEERRAEVHEQGRSTLDEMRDPDES